MYYILNHSLNLKIVGKFPQSESITNVDFENPKHIVNNYFNKIDFDPTVPIPILLKRSKDTDLISNVNAGGSVHLLISEKLKNIIYKNRKNGLQFFKTYLIQNKNRIDNYFCLNMYEVNFETLNFEKSEIYKTKHTFDLIEKLKIDSANDLLFSKKEIEQIGYPFGICIKKIEIQNETKLDFFVITNTEGGNKFIVTEKLKKEIEDAGCTGIEFQPAELSYNEWTMLGGEREKVYGKM